MPSAEPSVEGAPAVVLLLDDVLQAVDDQLVELDGGVALAAALLRAEVPVVQLKEKRNTVATTYSDISLYREPLKGSSQVL